MGYYSSICGDIEFDPPATWEEITSAAPGLFKFEIKSEDVDTPEGVLSRRSARRIVPAYDDQVKAYAVVTDLEKLLESIPGRTFSGEFRIEGEDAGDVQRLFVQDDGTVVHWKARLLWPDNSSEPGRGLTDVLRDGSESV